MRDRAPPTLGDRLTLVLERLRIRGREGFAALEARAAGLAGRIVFLVPFFVGIGIGLYFAQGGPASGMLGLLFVFVGCIALVGDVGQGGALARLMAIAVIAVGAGWLAGVARLATVAAPMLEAPAATTIDAEVLSNERTDRGKRRLLVAIDWASRIDRSATPEKLLLDASLALGDPLVPGTRFRAWVRVYPSPQPVEPGALDIERINFFKGIGGYGQIQKVYAATPPPGGAIAGAEALRHAVARRIERALPPEEAAIAVALIVGQRQAIPDAIDEDFRRSGLAHMLAISGLHMALFGGALFAALRLLFAALPWMALRWPTKKIAAVLGLFGCAGYLAISGHAVATERAFVMAALVFIAILIDRRALSLRSVALAATLLLLLRPESLLEPGFQMSFAAVAAIIALYEALGGRLRRVRRDQRADLGPLTLPVTAVEAVGLYLLGIVATSVVAGIATAPFSLFHFHQTANYGLLANALAMPVLSTLVMPFAVLALVAMPLGLEALPLWVMGEGIGLILGIGDYVAALPSAVTRFEAIPVSAVLVLVAGGTWVIAARGRPRIAGALALPIAAALSFQADRPEIVVDANGRTVGVMMADGSRAVLGERPSLFAAEQWAEGDGREPPTDGKAVRAAAEAAGAECATGACTLALDQGGVLAHVTTLDGFAAACRAADILVTPLHAPCDCRRPRLLIDAAALESNGAHAIRIDARWLATAEGPAVATSAGARGHWPWAAGAATSAADACGRAISSGG